MNNFRGRFNSKLDTKGRLSLPAAYRMSNESKVQNLVITNNLVKGQQCLDVFDEFAWQALEERISKLPQLKPEVQAYQRFYIASSQTVKVDSQNRLLIPSNLRQFAHLEDQIVLVGMGNKFELWSEQSWSQLYGDMSANFESILEQVSNLEADL